MKARAAVILIQDDKIALIERHRQGLHYFVFPGGKIESDELPAETAQRETMEELGLKVKVGQLVAEVWYLGNPQYYFLAEPTGGQFGKGTGSEMDSKIESKKGTYLPIWIDLRDLMTQPVLPKIMADFVWKSTEVGWPEDILVVTDQPPDGTTNA